MDAIDEKLLALLGDNSRASLKQLAAAVALSRTAVTERLHKLEQRGEITAYTIRRKERGTTTWLFLATNGVSCELLSPQLREMPEIRAMRSLGGAIDIVLEIVTEQPERLNSIREEISSWPEVQSITTAPVLKLHWQR